MRSETFGRLLKVGIGSIATGEGKTQPAIEDELGLQIGLTGASIQRYKAGHLPPERRTIEILAEAAVKRGLLGREWLERFLHAAQYPAPERLLDKLCPTGPVRQRPPRIYENLPAPTYSQFVMRQQAFADVIDGLQQRSAVVLIASLGGMGKTSLTREVASRCLKGEDGVPQFDAVVWVSDKDRPGTTNLSVVLDEIARTLDYPGFVQSEHEEKRREVEQLLRRQKVLLVVDNFETITDGGLLSWLLRLPEPSKAIVTSREKHRAFWSSWLVDLRGMSIVEAQDLIRQRLRALRIEQLVTDSQQFDPLVTVTGGNPKAIEVALGLIKHERRPLQQVVDDLYAARGELFEDLFSRAWALLDEGARRLLLSMTFFPDSASDKALGATADVQGFAFDRAVERLVDLALLDAQQIDLRSQPRYLLHPLVRAFAVARLEQQTTFEEGARQRWVQWYMQLAGEASFSSTTLLQLEKLDMEQESVLLVVKWLFQHGYFIETLKLSKDSSYYYYIRGLWDQNLLINYMGAESAHKLGEIDEEVKLISYCIQRLSMRGNIIEAEKQIQRIRCLVQTLNLSSDAIRVFKGSIGLYWMTKEDLDKAEGIFCEILSEEKDLPPHAFVINRLDLASCLYQKGLYDAAQRLLDSALRVATKHDFPRSTLAIKISLLRIDLDCGDFEGVVEELQGITKQAYEYQDRWSIAEIRRLYARLHTLRGDLPAARASLAEAIDLFERLGMRRELAEAREEMARLEAQLAAPSSP